MFKMVPARRPAEPSPQPHSPSPTRASTRQPLARFGRGRQRADGRSWAGGWTRISARARRPSPSRRYGGAPFPAYPTGQCGMQRQEVSIGVKDVTPIISKIYTETDSDRRNQCS